MQIKKYSIHRLIAINFIPNPENLPCIDHINRVKTDNRIENLRWVTHRDNMCNTSRTINRKGTIHKRTYKKKMEILQLLINYNIILMVNTEENTENSKHSRLLKKQKHLENPFMVLNKTLNGPYDHLK